MSGHGAAMRQAGPGNPPWLHLEGESEERNTHMVTVKNSSNKDIHKGESRGP